MSFRYFIRLSYKGTSYNGWQIQPRVNTIQETLNKNLSILLKEVVETCGAGRTDTGVHAPCFYAHFDTENSVFLNSKVDFIYHLNCILPKDIAVYDIFRVKPDIHARFSAISRTYQYRISKIKNPFKSEIVWYHSKPLDIQVMNDAAQILFEFIDFTSFSKSHTEVKTNNCAIHAAFWVENDEEIIFQIKADRFLRNMVRAIVGTLLNIGSHQLTLDQFREIIVKKDRRAAGISVEARGLHLIDIEYPEDIYYK